MPELPEMENYRRLLSEVILNTPITDVTVQREKSINMAPELFASTLKGSRFIFIERRGKYLIFHLSDGKRLLLHLMLGGLLYLGHGHEDKPSRNTQIEISFGSATLYFIGLRLGYLHLLSAKESDLALEGLGPDLFSRKLTRERFTAILQSRRGTLKSLLVNQQAIAGIGNSYADEIAFAAGLHPSTKVQQLTESEISRLYDAAMSVLTDALEAGGYMELPLFQGDERTGGFDESFRIYDREGQPCVRCGSTIVKTELSGRKVFYCPVCQP
ncbi:formamidopyrimidine-DNA glycosylase [Paenibacillus algicola]|uniref:Formamidopyrimidine-DNA glycosylase n=1 Tax=Paenibacillus algicola TaxID=2565926 RepID=A0A4P8XJE1_9BACL|nr:DNA-formamidopyrimidine glycosylase [Paenibacillus algicola]QCT02762.1 formamidopyrimidine-DNA glycosylase [Paenibacillus algicola]